MTTFLITYDLVGTDETSDDYAELIARIKAYGTWAKVAKSVWLVTSTSGSRAVFDSLWATMDADDRLFVTVVRPPATWINVLCSDDWLQKHV